MNNLTERFNQIINNDYYNDKQNVIGELSEKTLHKIIKNLYESDKTFQEVKINNYYVDICKENNIIEIQTKQFNKLRDKVNYLLSLNKYEINIVYPVFLSKNIYYLDDLSKNKKSPKKFKIPEVFYELYMIKTLLNNSSLQITLLLLDINEYRQRTNNRKEYVCYDRVPTRLVDEIKLISKDDYLHLLPTELSEYFTSKELSLITKTDLKYVNKMLNVLKYIGVIEVVGKDGRKYIYRRLKG